MIDLQTPLVAVTPGAGVLDDILHLGPMMIVAAWALLLLVTDAFAGPGRRLFQRRLAIVGLGIAAVVAAAQFGNWMYDGGELVFGKFLVVDHFALLLDMAILVIAAGVIAFGGDYARSHRFEYGEHETLVLIAAFGMMTLVHAADLVAIFLGLETMSIAVYVMVGARWNSRASSEAALKYFIMGAFSSGMLIMGIALLYGATGVTALADLGPEVTRIFHGWMASQPYVDLVLAPQGAPVDAVRDASDHAITGFAPVALFFPGMLFVLGALLFKVSAVPFHMWTPDAYEGAPSPTTAFMAAAVKIGGFAVVLKLFVAVFNVPRLVTAPYGWTSVVSIIAFATMTIGNLAAVKQTNVKRLLAYSSVAHVGYLLVGVVAAASFYGQGHFTGTLKSADQLVWSRDTGDMAVASILFYLLVYAAATLGAFACVSWFGANKKEGLAAHEWSGVALRHPGMALGLTICLLALMGMPPTAGFFGKLFVFRSAFENDNWLLRALVVAALLNSVVGAYYYLRLIVAMYFRPPPVREIETLQGRGAPMVVGVAATLSLVMAVFAGPIMKRCQLAAAGFAYAPGEAKADWVDTLRKRWETEDAEAEEAAARPPGAAQDEKPAGDGHDELVTDDAAG
jgi:NADH-quinone oxidoreductase subunit N